MRSGTGERGSDDGGVWQLGGLTRACIQAAFVERESVFLVHHGYPPGGLVLPDLVVGIESGEVVGCDANRGRKACELGNSGGNSHTGEGGTAILRVYPTA